MAPTPTIDLNADLGEGSPHDDALLQVVTSASIACGAHAGDRRTMWATCEAAVARGVMIGAHPGYPDRENFGRAVMDIEPGALFASIHGQLLELREIAEECGGRMTYVKPHGALYHRAAVDRVTAEVLCDATGTADPKLKLVGPPGAKFLAVAQGWKQKTVVEGFVDRAYVPIGKGRSGKHPELVGRDQPGALLDAATAIGQATDLALDGIIIDSSGEPQLVEPRTLCLHGDTPGAAELAPLVRAALERAGVVLEAFTR